MHGNRRVVKLTRITCPDGEGLRTLHFTFEGGQRRSSRARCSFIEPADVPAFDGEEAWFEVEEVIAKPWPFWRAVRQVES